MTKIAKAVKKVIVQSAVLLFAGASLAATLNPVAKADNNNKIAQTGEVVVGDINRGDADQHCKYWNGKNAYVKSFDTENAVAVCSKNGQNAYSGGISVGESPSINGNYTWYEGAIDVNVSFDELCVGKYEQNPYSRVNNVSNIHYDYWQGHCVGTPNQPGNSGGDFLGPIIFFP